jgi:multidrug transporter EmrE-like cation transporter
MKPLIWTLILAGVALNAAAQLSLKAATLTAGALVSDTGQVGWQNAARLFHTLPFWTGLACYGFSVILWLGALSRVPVSVAYPMLSLGYIANAFAAAALFGEVLTAQKMLGIAIISVGVVVLSRTA